MRPAIPAVTVLAATAIAASTAFAQEGNPPEPVRNSPETRLAAPGTVKPTLKLALDAIKADRGALGTKQRGAVNTRLTGIQNALKRGDNCEAVQGLRSLRGGVGAAKGVGGDAGRPRMNIAAASLQAEALLKFSSKTKNCGGGATPPRTNLAGRVPEQSTKGLTVQLGMPVPRFDGTTVDSKSFIGLRAGDLAPQGAVGEPGLPFASQVIAIPEGASVKVTPESSDGITLSGVDLAPVQEDAPDQEPQPPVFNAESPELRAKPLALSNTAYNARRPFPPRSFTLQSLGTLGGVRLAVLSVPVARFVPGTRSLRLTTAARFKIEFTGGKGTFADQRLKLADNADTSQLLAASVINFRTVASALGTITIKPCGEDLIVVTPPALKPAADRLAAARNAKGIKTEVFQYGAGQVPAGGTKESLRAFIQNRVAVPECSKTVKWVLLLGDSTLIPTWGTGESGSTDIPSDVPYSQPGAAFTLPNVGMGRIPAGTLEQAEIAISKQINYTDAPPADPGFYNKATVAGYFQIKECNDSGCSFPNGKARESRRYMTSVTKVFAGLQAFGKTVDKYVSRQAESVPFFLNDGSLMPFAFLGTAPYTGTGAGVRDALNDGRWLLFHRDHAGPGGWGDPGFTTTEVNALTNGNELPLVLSINCSSGAFDQAGQNTFVDRFMFNPNGGAVGVISATRNTPSFRNEEFARPLANALTGGKVSSAGHWLFPISTPIRRASSVMQWGRILLGMRAGFDGTWRNMLRYYHYFGDPSVRIYTNGPAA